jgi:hypothetical protein
MKASFENIEAKKADAAFLVYKLLVPASPLSALPSEYELTLITKGEGKRLAGDSYEDFMARDLVLLGTDCAYLVSSPEFKEDVSAIVIQFSGNSLKVSSAIRSSMP